MLQRRRNHETFELVNVSIDERPDLARRFGVEEVPTILVLEGPDVRSRIVSPRGCRDLEHALETWLH